MDTVPKFVQLIKLVQQECGKGNARVRPPRLEVSGAELAEAQATIKRALAERPRLAAQA
jgi:4-hydroxy-tetrahydrodipicolinate synthase